VKAEEKWERIEQLVVDSMLLSGSGEKLRNSDLVQWRVLLRRTEAVTEWVRTLV